MTPTDNILLYTPQSQHVSARLQSMIEAAVMHENIIIVRNINQLFQILRQPANRFVAAIILAENENELIELTAIRDSLLRIPIILILPDQNRETITRGHVFRPRYMAYAGGDFSDVRDVFKKIVGRASATLQ